jgi:hypothetical protein
MFEPGMKMHRVRLTRDGEDAGGFILRAFDVDDAVARAKAVAAQTKEQDPSYDNPFDNLVGLEAWVSSMS